MGHSANGVQSHDIAATVDSETKSFASASEIKRSETASAQQITMVQKTLPSLGINVLSHDIASRGDPPRKAKGRAREINRGKLALAPQVTMDPTGRVVLSHNFAARVDPNGRVEGRAREVNRGKAVGPCETLRRNA
jgi:hypothetical protein